MHVAGERRNRHLADAGAHDPGMRVLLTSLPATGHFHSLLPLAEGLADAGHEVAVCCTPAFEEQVTEAGFEHLSGGAEAFEELFVDAPPRGDPDRVRWAHRHRVRDPRG